MKRDMFRLSLKLPLLVMLLTGSRAWSAALPFFNTGVTDSGADVALGGVDPHWSIVAGPGVTKPQSAYVLTAQRDPLGTYYVPVNSQWIWAAANGVAGINSPYTFQLSFNLAGFDPTSLTITGKWGVDNVGTIYVNGAPAIGTGDLTLTNAYNFETPNPFSLTGGFHSGLNTIDIKATDFGSVGGLDVTALAGDAAPIPEPSTWATLMLGLLVVPVVARRQVNRRCLSGKPQ